MQVINVSNAERIQRNRRRCQKIVRYKTLSGNRGQRNTSYMDLCDNPVKTTFSDVTWVTDLDTGKYTATYTAQNATMFLATRSGICS